LKEVEGGITAPKGFKAAGVHCGIKKTEPDLALIYSEVPAVSFGMFTSNRVKAAPVDYSLRKIRRHRAQAIIINSGNANACTGEKGLKDAEKMARLIARELGVKEDVVLVASTGRIGEPLPMSKIETGIRQVAESLSFKGGHRAAQAILTTDKITKEIAVETNIPARGKGKVVIGGVAKGAGMISPNLATMLCFITTDACITEDALEEATRSAVNKSFNQISVDGDMSTNDSLFILANGLSRNKRIKTWYKKKKIKLKDENFDGFCQALDFACGSLARLIVRDGEGATKFIQVKVKGAPFPKDARRVARAVASSTLVKTAIAGASPNWGRVMSALGAAHAKVKPNRVDVYFDNFLVVKGGMGVDSVEGKLGEVLKQDEVKITIDLHQGKAKAIFWGCDLTERYVKINKRYV
jgi:glutamate N-acetyltransferase/amino-acid N-acetyltransferase